MRTALITVGDKQQVVLQPENKREHRILQMLLDGNKEVQVKDSELEVTEYGSLVPKPQPAYHQQYKDHPTPVIIQVQPEAPKPKPTRNPEVLVLGVDEMRAILLNMYAVDQGLHPDSAAFDANISSRVKQSMIRIQALLEDERKKSSEPDPYL